MTIERHCDPITMDHIIELRRQLREAERQRDNALAQCTQLMKRIRDYQDQLMKYIYLGETNDDDRDERS